MRNHHRKLYRLYVCGALAWEGRSRFTAEKNEKIARTSWNDHEVSLVTVHRDTTREERART